MAGPIAPYDVVRSPAPLPPRHSLLKRAFDLDAASGDDTLIPPPRVHYPNAVSTHDGPPDVPIDMDTRVDINRPTANQRWEGGFEFYPEGCGTSVLWVPCGASNTSSVTDTESIQIYQPTWIQVDISRSSFGYKALDFQGRAQRFLDVVQHRAAGAEFWNGTKAIAEGLPNNYLTKAGFTDLGTAANTTQALTLLQTYLDGAGAGGWGYIHAPKRVVNEWETGWLVEDDHTDPENVSIIDSYGNEIIADPGYPQVVNGGGKWEIYATGPVYGKLGGLEIVPEKLAYALNRSVNLIEYRAQRPFALVYDGCAHAKIQVSVT